MNDFKFEIIESFGVISESPRGWKKELKLISWNERDPRYDIREWSPDTEKMGRGITMSRPEIIRLKEMLNEMTIEEDFIPS